MVYNDRDGFYTAEKTEINFYMPFKIIAEVDYDKIEEFYYAKELEEKTEDSKDIVRAAEDEIINTYWRCRELIERDWREELGEDYKKVEGHNMSVESANPFYMRWTVDARINADEIKEFTKKMRDIIEEDVNEILRVRVEGIPVLRIYKDVKWKGKAVKRVDAKVEVWENNKNWRVCTDEDRNYYMN